MEITDLERAVVLADNIANTAQGQEENIQKARTELEKFTNPYAADFLNAVIEEYRIAG